MARAGSKQFVFIGIDCRREEEAVISIGIMRPQARQLFFEHVRYDRMPPSVYTHEILEEAYNRPVQERGRRAVKGLPLNVAAYVPGKPELGGRGGGELRGDASGADASSSA